MSRRIVIIGGPRTGKTTLSERLRDECGISVLHTSHDLEELFPAINPESWSKQSEHASKWVDAEGDWILEGVQMARALRKWLRANPEKPLDLDILLQTKPYVTRIPGQEAMTKGVWTVFHEIEAELKSRGARVHKLNDSESAIEMFRSAVPDNFDDAEAVPMLKRKLTKEEFDKLSDAQKELYKDPGNNGNYVLDAEPDENTEPLKTALEREKAATAAAKKTAEELAAKYKDFDTEEYKRLKAAEDEAKRQGKKEEGDWEGWKETFLKEKETSDAKFQEEITKRDARIRTFLLDDKIKQAAREAGVRTKLLPHVVTVTMPRFRLDKDEKVEVLDEHGNPISVSIEAFFKDKYVTEFPEYYEPTGAGGSGASNNGNGSRGGARVVSRTDQAALNANLEDIAKGVVTVQE